MTLQEYNDLYKRPLLKQMTIVSSGGITIKNANIVSEEMSLEKSLCSENNLRYGRCEAACFKVRIADINHDFTGEWLTVTQDVVTDSEGYLLTQNGQYLLTEDGFKIKLKNEQIDETSATYGRFRVHSDKPSNDRRWRDLTCYDIMYDILNADVISWYNGLTFPMTLKNLRDSFFTYLGITQETTTLINDSFVTPGGFSVSGSLSGKTVIESICELNGVFGQITGDGKFQYVSLSSPPTLTLDYYVDGTGSYEDYVTEAVTGINAKGTTDDVGTIVGTNTNLYIINGNPLIYGTEGTQGLTTALNNLLQHIMAVQYRPFGVTTYGNPMLPLGTKLTINTSNQIIVSYVVKKTLNGIQSLKDTLSATGEKHQPTAVNSPKTEITRTKGKVHELEVTVDGLTSRVSATETNLSNNYSTTTQMNTAIQQSATAITTQVSNNYVTQAAYNAEVQNLQDQIDGRIEYWDGNVVPTLNNAPASSWTTDAAKSSHVGDLYRYHHGTPEVVDYYRFDKDTSTTPATYSWVALGASQVDEALRLAEEANDKADAAQAQLDALQQSVEDDYYTKTQTDSKISQSATAITQSVSSTYETKSNATSNYNALDSAAQGYANSALATANTNAQGYANDAKNAANTATDTKLGNYYTKTQTDSQISQTATSITTSVSETYETKSDASDKLATANTNAQGYANTALTTARSEISQLSNKVAVKVNSSGRLVTAELGVDPASSTSYVKVKADDLDIIANGNLQLTAKTLGIDSTYFKVSSTGVITATSGTIGGFTISETAIQAETGGSTHGLVIQALKTTNYDAIAYAIRVRNSSSDAWTYPFIVRWNGHTTMTNANVTGTITTNNLTATGGAVGGWKIQSWGLYDDKADTSGSLGAGLTKYGSGPALWAGSDLNHINTAPFRVLHDGTLCSTKLLVTGGSLSGLSVTSSAVYMTYTSSSHSGISNTAWPIYANSPSTTNFQNASFRVSRTGKTFCDDLIVTDYGGDTSDKTSAVNLYSVSSGGYLAVYNSSANVFFQVSSAYSRVSVVGDFVATGTKNRIVKTKNYGNRLLYCYETPTPMFGDIGEGKIAEDGKCYVWLDSTFSETIKTESYQVFLQKYGQGECYVTERTERYFIVEGKSGLKFGWELKARQAGYENLRLEKDNETDKENDNINYGAEAIRHIEGIGSEREVA